MADLIYTQDGLDALVINYDCCFADLMLSALKHEMYGVSDKVCYIDKALHLKRISNILANFTKDGSIISYTSDGTATIDISALAAGDFTDNMFIEVTTDYTGSLILASFLYDGLGDATVEALRDELIIQINAGGSGYTADTPTGIDTFVLHVPTTLSSLPTGTTITIVFAPSWRTVTPITNLVDISLNNHPTYESYRFEGLTSEGTYVPGVGPTAANGGLIYIPRNGHALRSFSYGGGLAAVAPYTGRGTGGATYHTYDFLTGGVGLNVLAGVLVAGATLTHILTVPAGVSPEVFKVNSYIYCVETSAAYPRGEFKAKITGYAGANLTVEVYDTWIRSSILDSGRVAGALPAVSTDWSIDTYFGDPLNNVGGPGVLEIYTWDGTTDTIALNTTLEVASLGDMYSTFYSSTYNVVYVGGGTTRSSTSAVAYIDLGVDPLVIAGVLETKKTGSYFLLGSESGSFAQASEVNGNVSHIGQAPADFVLGVQNTGQGFGGKDHTTDVSTGDVYYSYGTKIRSLKPFGDKTIALTYDPALEFNLLTDSNPLFKSVTDLAYDNVNDLLFMHVVFNGATPTDDYGVLVSYNMKAGTIIQIAASEQIYPHPSFNLSKTGAKIQVHTGINMLSAYSETTSQMLLFDLDSLTWIYNVIIPGAGNFRGIPIADAANRKILFRTYDFKDLTAIAKLFAVEEVLSTGNITSAITGTVTPNLFDGSKNCLAESQIAGLIETAQIYCCDCAICN